MRSPCRIHRLNKFVFTPLVIWAAMVSWAHTAEAPRKKTEPNRGGEVSLLSVDPQVALKHLKAAEGYEVNLFASEQDFPLDNPVSLTFDAKGRLWVATMPTYPQVLPGKKPSDKLIILEDTDHDGRADKHTVFIDGLYLPGGFELGDGGAYIAEQPNLIFAKDTDGDDVADVRETVLYGFGTEDSHHAISAFTWGPGGGLYFQEGTFLHSQVETPYGPVRLQYAGVFRYKPRRFSLDVFVSYPFANPWGHVFDRWGQNFIADASGGANYFGTAISGHVDYPNKHAGMKVFTSIVRPTAGCEIVRSRQFPDEAQGNFLVNNCIGFQGIKQHRVIEEGSGFTSKEVAPLLESFDINFRPVDLQFGPDGALYVVDWFNPLIGHMQYSLRDNRRDHKHGRIWRITYKHKPLLTPPKIAGQPIPELLDLLKSYEDRTRYRTRRELGTHDPAQVAAELKRWIAALDKSDKDYEHQLLEALWVYQTINVIEPKLLDRMLRSPEPHARAAATRVLRYWRGEIDRPLEKLETQVNDPYPRVRLEAVLACSFFTTPRAAEIALQALNHSMDYYLDYAMKETIGTLERYWKPAILAGQPFAVDNPAGVEYILDRLPTEALVHLPPGDKVDLTLLTRHDAKREQRADALEHLAKRRKSDELSELFSVIESLDTGGDEHADHALIQLGAMLSSRDPAELQKQRPRIERLASSGRRDTTRQIAYAAWLMADGGADSLWPHVARSAMAMRDFLAAVPLVQSAQIRAALYDRVAPLLDGLPQPLATEVAQSGSTIGRYVRIELPGKRRTLTLAEVEVLSGGKNIARSGKARQLNTAFGGRADRAIDGNPDGVYAAGSQTHTRENVENPWWEVDLKGEHPIDAVVVFNRTEAGGRFASRLDGFTLKVLDRRRQAVFTRRDIPAPKEKMRIETTGDPTANVRLAAIEALPHIGRGQQATCRTLARFVRENIDRDAAIRALRAIGPKYWDRAGLEPLATSIVDYVKATPPAERTDPAAIDAFELGRKLASLLPSDVGQSIRRQLGELGVKVVLLRAVPHQMRYDRKAFAVEAGKPVEIVFQNTDIMPHNVIIAAPGKLVEIGQASERMTTQGDAYRRQFIPDLPSVLHSTNLVQTGQVAKLKFIAPRTPGEYPYLCTFPGHFRTMNGTMYVARDVEAFLASHPLPQETVEFEVRPFVKDWTFDELVGLLGELQHGRSWEHGRAMFKAASCVACHKLGDDGHVVGPDLALLRKDLTEKKRSLADVLREVVEPSKIIKEKYRSQIIITDDGRQFTGLVVDQNDKEIRLLANPLAEREPRVIPRDQIDEQVEAKISLMPKGLLNTLDQKEILDLLAYILAGGNPQDPAFQP